MVSTNISDVGTQKLWVPIFFKNFFANLKQGIIQEEGAFSSEVAVLPSIFEIICFAVGIENTILTWCYSDMNQPKETLTKTFLRKCKILLDPYGGRKYIN